MIERCRFHRRLATWLLSLACLFPSATRLRAADAAPIEPRGTLFIVGGGKQPDAMVVEFIRLAGGPGAARIAVLPMASEDAAASGESSADQFRRHGAAAFVVNPAREQAADAPIVKSLDEATGVWFGGGDQTKLVNALVDTPVLAAVVSRYRAGAVVGGTSAGAAVLSAAMITGNQIRREVSATAAYYEDDFPAIARDVIEVSPGFGLLPGAIVDQHFVRRERFNRLLSAVLERPQLLGVGIDESTALVVPPTGDWTVLGESAVVVVDARGASVTKPETPALGAAGVRLHVLPAGASFNPKSGDVTLPEK
jgi:cyanophycinase